MQATVKASVPRLQIPQDVLSVTLPAKSKSARGSAPADAKSTPSNIPKPVQKTIATPTSPPPVSERIGASPAAKPNPAAAPPEQPPPPAAVCQTARPSCAYAKATAASNAHKWEESREAEPPRPQTARGRLSVPSVAMKTTSASRGHSVGHAPVAETSAPLAVAEAAQPVQAQPAHAQPHAPLAKPKAPELSTAKRAPKAKPPTSEELELLNAMREIKEQQLRRDKWRSQLDKVLADVGTTLPARSTMQLTVPKEFELHAPRSQTSSASDEEKPVEKPVAEQVRDFHKTPKRFRSRPSNSHEPPPKCELSSHVPTQPVAVVLSTEQRAAAHKETVKSFAEIEAEQMASMPKFKALPLNRKVLESGMGSGHLGVPRVQKPKPTQPEAFNLSSNAKTNVKPLLTSSSSEPNFSFKARPFNKELMQGKPMGVRAVTPRKPTEPHSPHLSTTARASTRAPAPPAKDDSFATFKARPMPVFSPTAAQPPSETTTPRPTTSPRPFSLTSEARHVAALAQFQQRIAREEEELRQSRAFKARPMPVGEAWAPANGKAAIASGEARPFSLQTDARHDLYEATLQERLRAAEEDLRKSREFHARSADVVHKQKFVPAKSTKPLTEVSAYEIRSEKRAEERRKWEAAAAAARADRERQQRQAEIEKLKREAEEIAALRKSMVPHARPATVLKAKPFKPQLASARSATCTKA